MLFSQAISNLMAAGADPRVVNSGGEAPAHIVVQIQDIQMMACFLDFLSKEDMNIKVTSRKRKENNKFPLKDSFGDSLLHYVAAAMDEDAIFKVLSLALALQIIQNATLFYCSSIYIVISVSHHELNILTEKTFSR